MNDLWRYIRQVQVLGEKRQRELLGAEAVVDDVGLSGLIEALYLSGGGVGTLRVRSEAIAEAARALNGSSQVHTEPAAFAGEDPLRHYPAELSAFSDDTARAAAAGALSALCALCPDLRGSRD